MHDDASPAPTVPGLGMQARELWQHLEVIHAVVYFNPSVDRALRDVGMRGFWMGYFAARAAAMGAVDAAVVKATFYNFHPAKVDRAIPDAWALASPARILAARAEAAGRALRADLAECVPAEVAAAAALSTKAAHAAITDGRPLAAAHRALPVPEAPIDQLWWAASVLREHRGDGHVALLTERMIDGCEAHVLQAATDRVPKETLQGARGWTDDDWGAARTRLVDRGLVDARGRVTPTGDALKAELEARTDELASAPYRALSDDERARLLTVLAPLSTAVAEREQLPFPNPIGVDRPAGAPTAGSAPRRL